MVEIELIADKHSQHSLCEFVETNASDATVPDPVTMPETVFINQIYNLYINKKVINPIACISLNVCDITNLRLFFCQICSYFISYRRNERLFLTDFEHILLRVNLHK